jgi:hypothetical protein
MAYFKHILIYFQNELLAPYLHLNYIYIYISYTLFPHTVCNKMEVTSLSCIHVHKFIVIVIFFVSIINWGHTLMTIISK